MAYPLVGGITNFNFIPSAGTMFLSKMVDCISGPQGGVQGACNTSARIRTALKGNWLYGKFEISAKLPKDQGIWPAIWMLPTEDTYGSWAASGEIDIVELIG